MAKVKQAPKKKKVIDNWGLHQKALIWCIRNHYRIYPQRHQNLVSWEIVVEMGLKKAVMTEMYKQSEIQYGIYQALKTIYLKHNPQ